MKRKILIVVGVLVVVGLILAVVTFSNLGKIIKVGVEKGGTVVLGVPVTLKDATVSVKEGSVGMDGLAIGSPAGFTAPDMFSLGHASATVDIGSLRGDEIVVKEVVVDGPRITLEFAGGTTNWGTLMARLQKEPSPEEKAKESKKKMRIDRIAVSNGKITIAGIPLAGSATVPLPSLELKDVGSGGGGGGGGGSSVRTVIADVVSKLYAGIIDAAGSVVPTEQLQKLGAGALSAAGQAGGAAAGAAKGAAGAAAGAAKGALKGILGGGDNKDQ
jgi:hypothetical protein